jgi:hypothetical protein
VTIFDYIKDIAVTKRGNLPLNDYVPYLVNRWISFMNPTVCEFINGAINSSVLLENKELHYKTLICSFPKLKSLPRLNYIKKLKEDIQEEDNQIKALAHNLEISEREARLFFD